MLNKVTKQRIEECRDILVGQLPLPSDQINMITLLLIYKFMNDIDEEYALLNKSEFFVGELAKFAWKKIIDNTTESPTENIADRSKKLFYEGIQAIRNSTHLPALFKDIFNEGNIPLIADNDVFRRLTIKINFFKYDHSEELGNAFEYLLMTMGTQANNGQFRTPRHIIDFIVEAVDPEMNDTFLDPACGTGGFLISAFKYLQWKYTPEPQKEVLMDIAGEVRAEIMVEKKVKKEIVQEKTWVTYKIYSSNEKIWIENAKKDQDDQELDSALACQIVKADIVYKKQSFIIEAGTLAHNGTYWEVRITQSKPKRTHQPPTALPATLPLRAIAYTNIFNQRQDKTPNAIQNAFQGYDNTPMMVRLAKVNMYLHQFKNPQIHQYDSISNDSRWNNNFSCILANPPFMTPKGGVEAHKRFTFSNSKKAEILFSDYIASHLLLDGKAGFIVPEGIIFTNNTDYVALRKHLLQQAGLWAVISLPAGVFQPYSGVKTSILLIDKAITKQTDNVLLLKVGNDGYSLNTNRNPLDTSDLPEVLAYLAEYKKSLSLSTPQPFHPSALCLHKSEFAKLDAYKAANTALDALRKAWREVTNYAGKLPNTPNDKQRAKLHELTADFLLQTGLPALPATDEALKADFEQYLKASAIAYGALEAPDLPALLRNAIDDAREFNLAYEKYALDNSKIENSSYEWVYIGDLCETGRGRVISQIDIEKNKGEYPVYSSQTTNEGILGYINTYDFEGEYGTWTTDGANAGTVFYRNGQFSCTNVCGTLKAKNDKVFMKYLVLVLNQLTNDHVVKVGNPKLMNDDMESIQIPLPPLDVQARIVGEIEQYQRVIAGCRQVIDNYTVQITPEELADAEMVRLGEVCELQRGRFSHRPRNEPRFFNGKYPFIQTGDVVKAQGGIVGYVQTLNEDGLKVSKLFKPTIVLVTIAANIGDTAILNYEACFTDSVVGLIPNSNISPYYLELILRTKKEYLDGLAPQSAQKNLSVNILESVEIPLPSLSVQESIVSRLESEREAVEGCRRLIAHYEARIGQTIGRIFAE